MSLFVFKENEFWGRRKDNDLGFSILKNHPEENDSIERKEYGFLGKKGGKDKMTDFACKVLVGMLNANGGVLLCYVGDKGKEPKLFFDAARDSVKHMFPGIKEENKEEKILERSRSCIIQGIQNVVGQSLADAVFLPTTGRNCEEWIRLAIDKDGKGGRMLRVSVRGFLGAKMKKGIKSNSGQKIYFFKREETETKEVRIEGEKDRIIEEGVRIWDQVCKADDMRRGSGVKEKTEKFQERMEIDGKGEERKDFNEFKEVVEKFIGLNENAVKKLNRLKITGDSRGPSDDDELGIHKEVKWWTLLNVEDYWEFEKGSDVLKGFLKNEEFIRELRDVSPGLSEIYAERLRMMELIDNSTHFKFMPWPQEKESFGQTVSFDNSGVYFSDDSDKLITYLGEYKEVAELQSKDVMRVPHGFGMFRYGSQAPDGKSAIYDEYRIYGEWYNGNLIELVNFVDLGMKWDEDSFYEMDLKWELDMEMEKIYAKRGTVSWQSDAPASFYYEGDFQKGKRHGKGFYTCFDDEEIGSYFFISGGWKNDVPDGKVRVSLQISGDHVGGPSGPGSLSEEKLLVSEKIVDEEYQGRDLLLLDFNGQFKNGDIVAGDFRLSAFDILVGSRGNYIGKDVRRWVGSSVAAKGEFMWVLNDLSIVPPEIDDLMENFGVKIFHKDYHYSYKKGKTDDYEQQLLDAKAALVLKKIIEKRQTGERWNYLGQGTDFLKNSSNEPVLHIKEWEKRKNFWRRFEWKP